MFLLLCYLLQATVPSLQDWLTKGDVFRWKEKASVLLDCIFETSSHLHALERNQIYGAATLLPHKIELWTQIFFWMLSFCGVGSSLNSCALADRVVLTIHRAHELGSIWNCFY